VVSARDPFAERLVIGALLQDPRVLRSVQEECVPSDFEDLRLGAIYAGIVQMTAKRLPVDYVTVWDQLADWDVRGIDLTDLMHMADEVPTATSASYYAGMVREGAVARGLQKIAARMTQGLEEPGVTLAACEQEMQKLRDRTSPARAELRTLRQVMDVPASADEFDWVVPGLLERKDRFILTGGEGGGKSVLLRQIAVMCAAGLHPFSAQQVQPSRVLVVDVENSERQWRRASRGMIHLAGERGARSPLDGLHVEFMSRLDVTNASDLGQLHRLVDESKPDLMLIGPLYRLFPKSIKDDDDAAPVLMALDSLRDRGMALLIEAHAGHATSGLLGVRDLRPRGSSALLGWPEFGLGLAKPQRTSDPYRLLRWRGDRDERYWPSELRSSKYWTQSWPWEPTGAYWDGVGHPSPLL
jgi:hypothetical protein